MSIGLLLFAGVWLGLIVLIALGTLVGRWLKLRDDVVALARRDRRRAEESSDEG